MHTEGEIAEIRLRLGQRIRRLRMGRGWSQYQFSATASIDRTYLIEIEKGRRNVSVDNLIKISRGLGVSLSELCEGVERVDYEQSDLKHPHEPAHTGSFLVPKDAKIGE